MDLTSGTARTAGAVVPLAREPACSDLAALESRSVKAISLLEAIYGRAARRDVLQIVSAALASQHQDGSWGSNDDPRLKACYTAQTIDALLRMGADFRWGEACGSDGPYPSRELSEAVSWLLQQQGDNGQWGEDLWDTCEIVRTLLLIGVPPNHPTVASALNRLRSEIDADWPDRTSYWFGPGFHGVALELFNTLDDVDYAGKLIRTIWDYQDASTGRFSYSEDRGAHAPAEWQTACALIGLRSFGSVAPEPARVNKAYDWLRETQHETGCWSPGHSNITCYATRQAIEALTLAEGTRSAEARRGTDWFVNSWRMTAPHTSLSITLMGASAIARTHAEDLYGSVSFVFLRELADLLKVTTAELVSVSQLYGEESSRSKAVAGQLQSLQDATATLPSRMRELESDLASANVEVDRWRRDSERHEAQLQRYALRLTSNQLAVFGAVIGALGIMLTLLLA